ISDPVPAVSSADSATTPPPDRRPPTLARRPAVAGRWPKSWHSPRTGLSPNRGWPRAGGKDSRVPPRADLGSAGGQGLRTAGRPLAAVHRGAAHVLRGDRAERAGRARQRVTQGLRG